MKFKKSFFSAILVLALVSPILANPVTFDDGKTGTQTLNEIKSLVKDINFDFESLDNKTVKVHFMINTSNELVVLRTNSKNADKAIKYGLNYKSLKTRDLEVNKVYILPISIQAEGAS